MRVRAVVPGPATHGVVRHGVGVAALMQAVGAQVDVQRDLDGPAGDVTWVQFTDRIFGDGIAAAAEAFTAWADGVDGPVVVTLHDVPGADPDRARDARRVAGYARVVAACDAVVVCSDHEAERASRLGGPSPVVVPLPVEPLAPPGPAPWWAGEPSVGVLGFVYPGKGHAQALEAIALLPEPRPRLVALGAVSPGHEPLLTELQALAGARGVELVVTGSLSEADLHAAARAVTVPLAAYSTTGASASLATWLACRRRPLVAPGDHADEVERRWPGSLLPLGTDGLAAALAEPARTWRATPPPRPDVARTHLRVLREARGPAVVRPDAVLVPGNRWDLLPPGPAPSVAVVVIHFEQPDQLARVLDALAAQTLRPAEVVVADDGSRVPPRLPAGVRLVRQDDLGFRAAAARNLGAAACTSDVLVFLDADTAPEPGFVEALVRRVAACPDVLAVGRRRHADLSGDGAELPEPAWLVDGYAASRDLLDADGRSFRYVISAVMACRAGLFDDLGGFDERFVGYGGEDWDLAYRAWNAGAVLVHERAAVAWHDGPEWSARDGDRTRKDAESARLAALVPEPHTRGAPLPALLPDVLVDLDAYDPRSVQALLRQDHRDLQVRAPQTGELHAGAVRVEPWTADQQRRARVVLHLERDVALAPHVVGEVVAALTDGGLGEVVLCAGGERVGTARSTRALGRARRWPQVDDVVGRAFGRERLDVETVEPRGDLAGFHAAPWRPA